MLETTPWTPVWNILEEQVQVHLWICISHRYFQFIVHRTCNTRTQAFVEVLESLTYCIEVMFKK